MSYVDIHVDIHVETYLNGEVGVILGPLPQRVAEWLLGSRLEQFGSCWFSNHSGEQMATLDFVSYHNAVATDWDTQGESHAG